MKKRAILAVAAVALGFTAIDDTHDQTVGGIKTHVKPKIANVTFANLPTLDDGSLQFCTDCQVAAPCTGGGSGAFAFRVGSTWVCTIDSAGLVGSATPAGSDTQVQFNDVGAFGAQSTFTFAKASSRLTVSDPVGSAGLTLGTHLGGTPEIDFTGTNIANINANASIRIEVDDDANGTDTFLVVGGNQGSLLQASDVDGSVTSFNEFVITNGGAISPERSLNVNTSAMIESNSTTTAAFLNIAQDDSAGTGGQLRYQPSAAAGSGISGITDAIRLTTDQAGGVLISATNVAGQVRLFAGGTLGTTEGLTVDSDQTLDFPGYDCSGNANGGALTVDASGNVTCTDDDGGATPGGADTNIQFNGSGVFSGSSDFTWDNTNKRLKLQNLTSTSDGAALMALYTGTLPTTPSTDITGVSMFITSAGSAAFDQRGTALSLAAGYTGSNKTMALLAQNLTRGAGANLGIGAAANVAGNVGANLLANNNASSGTGHTIGLLAEASNSTGANVGVYGRVITTIAGSNIAVLGSARNSTEGTDLKDVGGWFTLSTGLPTNNVSVALGADNGSTTSDIARFYDNGTVSFRVQDAGFLSLSGVGFTGLGTPANGTFTFCTDCTKATPCAGSGNGAWAVRINGAWDCNV